MDAKEQQLVSGLCQRIVQRAFHERDVLALLILLREHAPGGSALRELADFVAHREKDRGSLQRYVRHVVAYGKAMVTGSAAELRISVVHTAEEFYSCLNAALNKFGLPLFERALADDILLSAMSLLQEVRLLHTGVELGRLGLLRLGGEIWLAGATVMGPNQATVIFPALTVPNTCCGHVEEPLGFPGLVEAACDDGRLRLYVAGALIA